MAEFDANDFESTFAFFLLSGLQEGPKSFSEIERRLQWAERLLYVAARRKGQQGITSLLEVLARLAREECLERERCKEQPGAEIVYSLTDAGKHRLEQERARRKTMASQFIEEAELDTSFRTFLDHHGPLGPG